MGCRCLRWPLMGLRANSMISAQVKVSSKGPVAGESRQMWRRAAARLIGRRLHLQSGDPIQAAAFGVGAGRHATVRVQSN